MRVLFISAWFPYPPDNGARNRVYNLIKALSQRHEVSLVSLLQEDSRPEDAAPLSEVCTVVSVHRERRPQRGTLKSLRCLFSNRPRDYVCIFNPDVKVATAEAIASVRPDVVVASTLGVAEYVPRNLTVPSVLEEHNCEYAILRRTGAATGSVFGKLWHGVSWRKNARWEAGLCRRYDAVITVSENDRQEILRAAPDLKNVCVVPNGVDTDHFTPEGWEPAAGALIYNGALTYGANLDAVSYFASDVYPMLAREVPNAKLRVTGRTGGVDLGRVSGCPGVELIGYVEDISSELRRSAACVVPLRTGGGSRLKILEAMAAGVPVVSTSIGAEGIDAQDGEHLLIADNPEQMAKAIVRVLTDSHLTRGLRDRARRLVEKHYAWTIVGSRFVSVVESVARRRGRRLIAAGRGAED